MNIRDKKVAVYLSKIDWEIVIGTMMAHVERQPLTADAVWIAGRNRIRYIVDEIVAKLPKESPPDAHKS